MPTLELYSAPQSGPVESGLPRRRMALILAIVVASLIVAIPSIAGPWSPGALDRFSIRRQPADVPKATAEVAVKPAQDDPKPTPARKRPSSRSPGRDVANPVSALGYAWPTTGHVSQEFGCTDFGLEPWNAALRCRFHHGIDIANAAGTPILAARSGRVVEAGWRDDGYGFRVVLDNGDGVRTLYAHMCCTPDVAVGDKVKRGEQIGLIGTTGASSGPHLHFAVEVNGTDIDPRSYLPDSAPDT
jgi:murein DD-endopeptidase MepM/ murein hydrolase activator NlpD